MEGKSGYVKIPNKQKSMLNASARSDNYLQVLLAMEHDQLGLDLAVLDVDLVAAQHDGDVLADAHQIPMPVGHVLVCDARRHVEHDDGALPLNVVAVTQTAELLLASGVPDVEANRTTIRVEDERMHFDAQRRHVLLLKLAGHVSLDERRLAGTAIAHQNALKGRDILLGHYCGNGCCCARYSGKSRISVEFSMGD